MGQPWTMWIVSTVLLLLQFSPTDSDSHDPFAQQPRILAQNGNLILKAAENHNVSLSSGSGHVSINDVDMNNVVSSVRNGGSSQQISFSVQRWVMQFFQQWRANIDLQLGALDENVTAISSKVNQFLGTGQESLSNRRLRRFMGKVQALTDKVNRLTQLLTENECSSNPCKNGGTCNDGYNGYICNCPSNWEGSTCETDVNECAAFVGTSFGCQNGATCVNFHGSYRCECPTNWHGVHCTEKHDDCSTASHQELCGHGYCVDEKRVQPGQPKYRCICDAGWRVGSNGPACTEDIDECAGNQIRCSQNPPVSCFNYPGSFHCGPCPAGYSGNGMTCSDVNECEVSNGGCSMHPMVSCSNTVGSRTCGPCPTGYVGNGVYCSFVGICAINRGGCHPMATCVENTAITGTYRECHCPAGYVGNGEGLNGCMASAGTSCANNPCVHGTCQMAGNSFHCSCNPGYFGTLCNQQLDPCMSSPCLNGGTCISSQGSFSCVCLESYEGPRCATQKRGCGGNLNEDSGTLRYPLEAGQEYAHGQNCGWLITVNETKVINILMNNFHTEHSANCEFDFLQFYDGPSALSQALVRFCGTGLHPAMNFSSTHNQIFLWFRSDQSVAGLGFELTWNATDPVCGGILEIADYGAINSPGYPGKYPRKRSCSWLVQVPIGKRIQFHFATLRLEHHENCSFDYLSIHDGASTTDPMLHQYCSTETPPPVITSGHAALLYFHSDEGVEDFGFHITYSAVPGILGCGGTLTAPTGTFSSPNYPDIYENMLNCEWLIRIQPNNRMLISFSNFHLEGHVSCRYDSVEVYDGASDTAPLLGRYCGTTSPPDLMSNSHQVYVRFRTDSSVRHPGFRAQYRTVCGGVHTELSGAFSSPYFPVPYPANALCLYDVKLPMGYIINVTFSAFHLESHENCQYDYLQVRDGGTEDSTEIGKYCGVAIPDSIVSTYNELLLKFVTDGTQQMYGFYAEYEGVEIGCGGVMTSDSGEIRSPMHPDSYPHSITCTWFLKAPPGYFIRLTFETFQIEQHNQCNFDYVLVQDSNGARIGQYCGSTTPPVLTSTENKMFVKFVADASVSREGFVATYAFLDANGSCVRDYYLESGVLKSPGYPSHYPHNLRCIWTLHAENNRQFILNVTNFQLEDHQSCRYDYLEIRNGAYETSPVIGRYCGMNIQRSITSHSNAIRFEFKTDSSQSAPGFEIYYDATTTGCGGTLKYPQGSIISPNYPQSYGFNADCKWLIQTSEGSRITLSIVDLDIEQNVRCSYDYLEIFDGPTENSRSLLKICNNQQHHGPIYSTGNSMFLRFRSDFSESGRGFHVTYQTLCNNVLKKRRGVIESPNFPNTYPHNHNCTWTITAPLGNNITIAFSHLFMEGGASCDADYIEVLDNAGLTSLAKYCGTPENLPPMIETATNLAMVRLVTDATVAREGFRLEYAVKGCGGEIRDRNQGFINTPNFPNGYPLQTECIWHIWYPPGSRVNLRITDLDLELSNDCVFDYLKVYGGEDESAPTLTKLCHKINQTVTVTSHGNEVVVHFYSDYSVTGKGFRASYSKLSSGCGGLFTAPQALIMSPNFPSAYNLQSDCSWLIEVDPNHLVILDFYDFNMPDAVNCSQGHVSIYDGNNSSAPLIKRLCGTTKPEEIQATGHQMLIRLTSDGINVANGFKAHYKTGCGRRLWADQGGEIVGPTYPTYLADNMFCNWIISASDLNEKVVLLVTHLQLFPDENCTSSVLIMDGDMPDSPMVKQLCLPHAPPPIISSGNSLHIISTAAQFRATYGVASSHCSGDFASARGTFTSPGFPNNYPMGSECVWTITSSAGSQVLVSFQSFQLETSDHCNLDYVELHENDASGRLIGRYCGNQIPSNLTASNRIWMKFKSDGEGTEAGFMAHYEIVHGNFLNGTNGIIESPGYPHQLYGNQIYEWTVAVPFGLSISIRFLTISIDTINQGPACISSVTVYDGPDDNSPELRQFCGFEIPDPVVSVGNVVFIKFNYLSYGEWRLEWTAVNNSVIVIEQPQTIEPDVPVCWQEFNLDFASSINLDSPNYPMEYNASTNCTYIVRASSYQQIVINFVFFELEGSSSCIFDKLDIYTIPDPTVNDWHLNQTLCGRMNATSFQAPNNLLKLVFKTDGSVQMKGFHSVLTSACGGHITGVVDGVLSTEHIVPYIQTPFRGLFCEWIIVVNSRRTIQLQFDSFNVPSDGACSSNYLLLRNGGQSTSPLLGNGKFCGSSLPSLPETTSNQVYVKLALSNLGQGTPLFQLHFRELSLGCNQHFFINDINQQVTLSSPNYPLPPPHDVECLWVIVSPSGTRMRIDFEDEFHMDRNCYNDGALEYLELRDGGTETSPLLRRICGHDQPTSQMTTGNALYVMYVTSVEHPESGFKATIRTAECGGVISGYHGLLESPHYPQNYSSSLECEWIVKTLLFGQLMLKMVELDTPASQNCSLTDYVEIRNHDSQGEILGLFCGQLENGTTIDIEAPGRQAYVKFKSNSAVTGKGFKMSMQSRGDRCGEGMLSQPSGIITSPNYPNAVPGRRECFWRIDAPEGRKVTITFNQLNLPKDAVTGICMSYIQIFSYSLDEVEQICGNVLPAVYESMTSSLRIQFITHGLTSGQGFELSYSTEDAAICGGLLQLPSGTISTPHFDIKNNTWVECKWRTMLQNQTIAFTFDLFDIPGEKANYCRGAALYIYGADTYYGSYCGNYTNKNLMIQSSAASTLLSMSVMLNQPIGGIHGSYNVSDCGGYLDGSNATITSPGYPNSYPPNTTCLWILTVPYGEEIRLNTVDMRLEDNCDKDYVMIRNGIRLDSPILGKFCGTHLPVPITTNNYRVSVLFHSDEYGTAPGFKMTTDEVQRGCGGLIHSKRGTITSPNYPKHYGNNVECVWTIELSHGFTANLTFVGRFDIEMENNCNKDYLLIEKFDGVSWIVMGKKCGRETPPPIQTDSRTVRITFRSDSDIGGDGFQIEYSGQCGGSFNDISGEIHSPNFPHEYEDNLNCHYVIGQAGHYVQIEFDQEHFSIEIHDNCRYDYIELFEGNTTTAPLIGKFCGTTPPATRMVLGPVLIHFVTDFIYVSRGFSAHYEILACGAVLTEPTGIIRSTLSKEQDHMGNMDCKWHIIGQQNKVVALKFDFFDVQPSSGCYADRLEIRDGNETGYIIATLCGNSVPNIVKSSGREMHLHFYSNYGWNYKGFKAGYYSTLGPQQGCGGMITTSSGEINSIDSDADGFYEPELDCMWYIISPLADKILKLEFLNFDIEVAENNSCRYDYVEVRENLGSKSALIGRFCGNIKPDPIIASGNKLTVSFHSDDKINKPGFKIKFVSISSPCGTPTYHVTKSLQTLTSPNYPNPYPLNLRCRWNIVHNGSENDLITISISRLDVPCSGDYLQIERSRRDLQIWYSTPIRFCGLNYTHEVIAKRGVFLTFQSDSIADGSHGFSLTYQLQNCNRTYTADNGKIYNPGYPRSSTAETNCMMTIVSHPGNTIALYFESFYMNSHDDPNCAHSGLSIYDGYNSSSPLLKKLCTQSYNTRTVVSTGHVLHLHLLLQEADATFSIGFVATSQGRGCGGTFTQERGMLTSPFFPQPYNVSSECLWLISVPAYHAISLYFSYFQLTNSNNCETNYLELYEGPQDVPDKRVQRVCEGDYLGTHLSTSNQVLLKLKTSPLNQGEGFMVHYETVGIEEKDESIMQATSSPETQNVQDGVLYLND